MKSVGLVVCLALVLVACELPRPEGAYYPSEAGVAADAGRPSLEEPPMVDAGAILAPPIAGGATTGGSMPGGGMPGMGFDAGGGTGGVDVDAATPLTPEQQALRKLQGRYLMRMDMLSTATATASIITLNTRNRVSHLIATELVVGEDGQLRGYERLCYQTFAHVCTRGCNSLTTVMSPFVKVQLVSTPYTERSYAVSGRTIKGLSNTMAIGFTDPSPTPRLPTVASDMRIWNTLDGDAKREGLLLVLDLSTNIRNVSCDVYTVQTFVSAFEGQLAGSALEPSLILQGNAGYALNTLGTDGVTLDSNNADCKSGEGPPPTAGVETVRFAPVGPEEFPGNAFWACPEQQTWDTRLPPPAP